MTLLASSVSWIDSLYRYRQGLLGCTISDTICTYTYMNNLSLYFPKSKALPAYLSLLRNVTH